MRANVYASPSLGCHCVFPVMLLTVTSDPGMVVSGEESYQRTVIYYSQTHVGEGLEAVLNERLATVAVDLGPSGGKSS